MSWAMLISLVVELLKARAAAGFPLLMLLLERFGWKIQEDADADTAPITVGAAPDEVKEQIIAWLEIQKAKSGVFMKAVYALVIKFVPLIADQIWDNLFQRQIVGKPLSDFTPAVMGSGAEPTEEEICAELVAYE